MRDPWMNTLAARLGDGLVLFVCLSLLAISLVWGMLNTVCFFPTRLPATSSEVRRTVPQM